ncbi:acyltransferase [Xanthomarina sp.]|uniref:acyltransferase family protein n=1 Tax=Xanthomarina sp. TaxID=1931211 RepID=UPI002CCCC30A|nr:acyltransferase [Xanthomarina sp.]HLV39255.1 acyltransferase [Xanthomarina sp.]
MGHIRTFLAIIVIISHTQTFYGFDFLGGKIAVQTFYIISGFYMALILNEKYIGINNSYKLFITNRFIRLYPVYWAVLIIIIGGSLLFSVVTSGASYGPLNVFKDNFNTLHVSSIIAIVFANVFIFFQDTLLFFEINLDTGIFFFQPNFNIKALNGFAFALIPQAWTVALELMFYLIAPFIVRRKLSIVLGLFMIFALLKYLMRTELGLTHTPWAFRFFPTELPLFLLGILSYKLYKSEHIKLLNQKVNLAILVFVIIAITMYDKIAFSFKPQIFFVMFFMAIPFIFELSKKSKIDRYVGELSYPLYLIHLFVIVIVSHLNVVIINKGITVLVISLVGSIGLKHLVSDRVESYRQNRLQKN